MYVLQNLHWFALLIGGLVFFHELGHFLVAKACGVKVLRFSLGFGPRLLGFTRGDTEYRVGAIPLGGYVKMLGDLPGADIPPEEADCAFAVKPLWQRSAIVLAGPVFNFVLAFGVYLAMFSGTQTLGDTRIGVVGLGTPAYNAGLRPGDKITAVNGEAVARWGLPFRAPVGLTLVEAIGSRPGQPISVTYERNGQSHHVEIVPAPRTEKNQFLKMETRGKIGVSLTYIKPLIGVIDAESPAATAGLKTDDLITHVGDAEIEAWQELRAALASHAGGPVTLKIKRGEETESVSLTPGPTPDGLSEDLFSAADLPGAEGYTGIVSKESVVHKIDPGTPAEDCGLKVGDRLLSLDVNTPDGAHRKQPIGAWIIDLAALSGADARNEFSLTVQRGRQVLTKSFQLEVREELDELKNKHTRHVFGAWNDAESVAGYVAEREMSITDTIVGAARQVVQDMTLIGKGIAMLLGGDLSIDAMGGPIMLFVIAEKSAKRGVENFLRMMAIISVNLGMLNLLPVPVLDGGHLMFFGMEAIRRRPPSMRTREIAHMVGLALLLVLMVLVISNDFLKFVLG